MLLSQFAQLLDFGHYAPWLTKCFATNIPVFAGMLQHIDGSILKPVQPPPRGEREVGFYTRVFDESCDDPVMLTLRPFLPKLLGIWTPPLPSTDDRVHCKFNKLDYPMILHIPPLG